MCADPDASSVEPTSGDEALIAAWREYRDELRRQGERSPRTYVDFGAYRLPNTTTTSPWSFGFRYLVPDLTRELINTLNRWNNDVGVLEAWVPVLGRRDQEARMDVLWEFVDPLATTVLTTPYRFKQNLIYAACRAIDFLQPNSESPSERDINHELLKTLGRDRPAAERLMEELVKLDGRGFQTATNSFRHRFEHRGGLGVEIGIRPTVNRFVKPEGVGLGFGFAPPLPLATLIAELKAEHARAVSVFETYWALVREIDSELSVVERGRPESEIPGRAPESTTAE